MPSSPKIKSEEEMQQAKERSATLERHVQTILVSLLTGAVMFAASYLFSDTSSKATSKVQLEVLTAQVVQLRVDIKALETSYVRRDDFAAQDARVRVLEANVAAIRAKIGPRE